MAKTTIGLLGGVHSGKTTYLAALYRYILRHRSDDINFDAVDPSSKEWLMLAAARLDEGRFEVSTTSVHQYHFKLTVRHSGDRSEEFILIVSDGPGGNFALLNDAVINWKDLATSSGLILMLDGRPESHARNLDLIDVSVFNMQQALAQEGRLDHRLAVCLSQYDDPPIFRWLCESDTQREFLKPVDDLVPGDRHTPYVANARMAIEKMAEGDVILRKLQYSFYEDRTEYMAISSTGFWRQPDGTIDWHDCGNVVWTPEGFRIRAGRERRPIQLLRPITHVIKPNS